MAFSEVSQHWGQPEPRSLGCDPSSQPVCCLDCGSSLLKCVYKPQTLKEAGEQVLNGQL